MRGKQTLNGIYDDDNDGDDDGDDDNDDDDEENGKNGVDKFENFLENLTEQGGFL